jgi:hypothetical protein
MTDFTDRFASHTYAQDETVTVTSGGRTHTLPERLFVRTQMVAEAYELHLLPTIDVYARTSLNPEQCRTLTEELVFIRSTVADPLLRGHLEQLLDLAAIAANSGLAAELIIEGP